MIKQSTEIVIQKFDIIYDEDPPKRFIAILIICLFHDGSHFVCVASLL